MTPSEFISVAIQLLAGKGEGHLRSAVSRAYYGGFHAAREFLSGCGVMIGIDALAHRNVIWCLANSGEPAIVDVSRHLEGLRKERNVADYELSSKRFVHRGPAKAEVSRAIRIVDLLAAYQADDAKNQVAPTIRAYAAKIGILVRQAP